MQTRQLKHRINPLVHDLEYILAKTECLWEELRGGRLFITGGTGFFGCWLLESFNYVNERLDLDASAVVLTRDCNEFKKKAPHLAASPSIQFHIGDIRDFKFPDGEFSQIIHAAATTAVATFNNEDPLVKFDTVVSGTRRVLDFAVRCHADKFLLTSSGVVYGKQPSNMTHIPEGYCGAPDTTDPNSAWGESKRAAEFLCAYYAKRYGMETKIARCFSFVGPYLQLDIHYAIGNFIRDGMNGGPIIVHGNGTPFRSYLYAADLAIWLWTILFKGKSCRPYNVGSEDAITIDELAYIVSHCFHDRIDVKITRVPDFNKPPDTYIPSTIRIQEELGLRDCISLKHAIRKTITWYKT